MHSLMVAPAPAALTVVLALFGSKIDLNELPDLPPSLDGKSVEAMNRYGARWEPSDPVTETALESFGLDTGKHYLLKPRDADYLIFLENDQRAIDFINEAEVGNSWFRVQGKCRVSEHYEPPRAVVVSSIRVLRAEDVMKILEKKTRAEVKEIDAALRTARRKRPEPDPKTIAELEGRRATLVQDLETELARLEKLKVREEEAEKEARKGGSSSRPRRKDGD